MIYILKNMKMLRKFKYLNNLLINILFNRILYADIVNFTPLSEKFTPPELVQILNKLFGKFDQLAQIVFRFSRNIFKFSFLRNAIV